MNNSQRGMEKKQFLSCPYCNSEKIVKNGHHHKDKLQFFCTSCHKYFYEDPAKGYPPTSIPFPVIAYLLYFRQKNPEFSNMRKFRKFVNNWLQHLKVSDQDISRQTIHHWIKNYNKFLDQVISFSEARDFFRKRSSDIYGIILPVKPGSYKRALKILTRKFGKDYCIDLIHQDPIFFQELVDIVSKNGVFCWDLLEKNYLESSGSKHSLSVG